MTRDDLIKAFKVAISNNSVLVVRHKNMKTVEFWVTGEEESVYQKLFGWWICKQTKGPLVQDTLKIKKEDLVNWEIV